MDKAIRHLLVAASCGAIAGMFVAWLLSSSYLFGATAGIAIASIIFGRKGIAQIYKKMWEEIGQIYKKIENDRVPRTAADNWAIFASLIALLSGCLWFFPTIFLFTGLIKVALCIVICAYYGLFFFGGVSLIEERILRDDRRILLSQLVLLFANPIGPLILAGFFIRQIVWPWALAELQLAWQRLHEKWVNVLVFDAVLSVLATIFFVVVIGTSFWPTLSATLFASVPISDRQYRAFRKRALPNGN